MRDLKYHIKKFIVLKSLYPENATNYSYIITRNAFDNVHHYEIYALA